MIDVHTVNQKKQRKYIDSYNTEEKNDWCACCKQKKKKQKKHIDSYMHAVNKKNKDSINQSPQLLISSVSYSLHDSYVHRFLFSNEYSLLSFYSSVCNKRQGKCWRIRIASPHNIRSSIWGSVTLLLCFSVHN